MSLLKDILRGIVIGIANVIPGVSGGTMMVSMGIYDKIISSITNLFHTFTKSVKTLFPYVIGMALGIVGLSFCIEFLFDEFPFQTAMLFIGLILGGVPVILNKVKGKKPEKSGILLFIIFFVLIIAMQFISTSEDTGGTIAFSLINVIILFFIGVIASATMIIPGVSGSMLLMALGYYNSIINSINGFVKAVLSLDISAAFTYAGVLIPFGIGVLVGIFAVAKLIELLLKKHERLTYFAILGLVIASPFAVLFGIGIEGISVMIVFTGLITFAAGFFLAYRLAA